MCTAGVVPDRALASVWQPVQSGGASDTIVGGTAHGAAAGVAVTAIPWPSAMVPVALRLSRFGAAAALQTGSHKADQRRPKPATLRGP